MSRTNCITMSRLVMVCLEGWEWILLIGCFQDIRKVSLSYLLICFVFHKEVRGSFWNAKSSDSGFVKNIFAFLFLTFLKVRIYFFIKNCFMEFYFFQRSLILFISSRRGLCWWIPLARSICQIRPWTNFFYVGIFLLLCLL